ncbi:hypothetical protein JDS79_22330 [Bacillus cereus]|nr:hypothetical protein [Bacillus cereus]
MNFIKEFIQSFNFLKGNEKEILAKDMEKDFHKSYKFIDYYLGGNLSSLSLSSWQLEELRNDFDFNKWFVGSFILPQFLYGWVTGFMTKYSEKFPQLNIIIEEFQEEAKNFFLLHADKISNYFVNPEVSHLYISCGGNMYHEGKDAGSSYKGSVKIRRL